MFLKQNNLFLVNLFPSLCLLRWGGQRDRRKYKYQPSGARGGKNGRGKKIMLEILTTNVVASRPPERRLTGQPTAPAKSGMVKMGGSTNP